MGSNNKGRLFSFVFVGVAAGLGSACGDGGTTPGGSGGAASGGTVGSGGATGTGGAKPSGGSSSSGGQVGTSGGGPSGGGAPIGGSNVGGGEPTTGGMAGSGSGGVISTGGAEATGGASTGGVTATGGVSESGGMGGEDGMGGEGMGGAGPELCGGCLDLFVPLAKADDATFFWVDLGAPVDLSTSLVTFTLRATSLGSAGSFQFTATTGDYKAKFMGWRNFATDGNFIDVDVDFTATGGYTQEGYVATSIRFIGIAVEGQSTGGSTWGDTTILVDSVTFDAGVHADMNFDSGTDGWAINTYKVVAGSTVTQVP
jgi:hypothetical protein